MSGTYTFPYPGAIDADGHTLEPPAKMMVQLVDAWQDSAAAVR